RKAPRPYGLPSPSGAGDNGPRSSGRRDPEARPAAPSGEVEARPAGTSRVDHEAADRGGTVPTAAGPEQVGIATAGGQPAGDERERGVLGVGAVEERLADRPAGTRPQRELAQTAMVGEEQQQEERGDGGRDEPGAQAQPAALARTAPLLARDGSGTAQGAVDPAEQEHLALAGVAGGDVREQLRLVAVV